MGQICNLRLRQSGAFNELALSEPANLEKTPRENSPRTNPNIIAATATINHPAGSEMVGTTKVPIPRRREVTDRNIEGCEITVTICFFPK